jgi:DNA-binding GntR family transcriptional regulator
MKVRSKALAAVAQRRSTSLSTIVQNEIEQMILKGVLEPGQRLNEQQLALQLGVSRGPVREALRGLERAGLLTAIANLGMFVRKVGIEEAIELYDVRGLLFGFSCSRLAEKITADQTAELRKLIAQMNDMVEGKDSSRYYQLNLLFHDLIVSYAGNARVAQIYRAAVQEGHLLRQRALQPAASMRESNDEHAEILDAICAGQGDRSRRLAEQHHVRGKSRWLNTLAR